MKSIDDIMKVVTLLFIKIFSGVEFLTWNVIPHKLWSWSLDLANLIKGQFAIYRPDQESRHSVDEINDQIYSLSGAPSVSGGAPLSSKSRLFFLDVINRWPHICTYLQESLIWSILADLF